MKPDDLDRVLSESREIRPSESFTGSVMTAVRREAEAPPPLAFPWKRALPGLAACATLTAVGVVMVLIAGPSEPAAAEWIGAGLAALRSAEVQWIAGSLLLSLLSFRGSMRLVGYRS